MARRASIVFVDDEPDLVSAFAEFLADLGHDTRTATSGAALEVELAAAPADLVVLDLRMPGENGIDVLRRLKQDGGPPVIVLTGFADTFERTVVLELGADDVLAKPIDPRELAARVLGVLARTARVERQLLILERVTADLTASRLLRADGPPERLSPGEVMLLRTFAAHPGTVLSREELVRLAPADSHDVDGKAIDNRIARLRQKLGTSAIVSVRGRGYVFVPPPDPRTPD